MKKFSLLLACFLSLTCILFAQDASEMLPEDYEAGKTKTQIIVPENQHITDQTASVKIEYLPMYDEVRIFYECMYVTYDRGEAMNTVLQCLADFQQDHKYYSYRYLRNDKERFFKDDKGRRKAQYMSYVKFSR